MSGRTMSRWCAGVAVVACVDLSGQDLRAAELHWDENGAAGFANDGGENWSQSLWSTTAAGTDPGAWANGNDAVFRLTSANYTVNFDGNYSVTGLTVVNASATSSNRTVTVSATTSDRTLTLASGAIVSVADSNRALSLTGTSNAARMVISGNLEKTGAGTLTLSTGSNSYVQFPGTVTVTGGTVGMNNFSTPSNAPHFVLGSSGTLSSLAVTNIQSLSGSAGSMLLSAGANAARGFTITQSIDTTFAGNVGANGNAHVDGVFNLTKAGTGTLRMSGLVEHDGSTTVSDGTLLLNGTLDQNNNGAIAPTTNANVNVAAIASLGGFGEIRLEHDHAISVSGTLAPGDPALASGVGTLTTNFLDTSGGFSANTGAKFAYDLAAPGTGDLLRFFNVGTGDVSFNSNEIVITDAGGLDEGVYTLMRFYSDAGSTLSDTGKPMSGLTLSSSFLVSYPESLIDYGQTGEVRLVVAIPEPASLGLLGLAAGALVRRRTRH